MVAPVLAAIPWIVGGLQLLGGATSASAEKKAGDYNAKIARTNAGIQRRLAKDAIKRGDKDEAWHRMDVAQLKSDQKAKMLAGGMTHTGSNSRILDDTAIMGELDALTIRSNAETEAWGHDVNAQGLDMQANLAEMGGNANAFATVINTGSQVAQTWGANQ